MEKKEEKELQMTSAHGNKIVIGGLCLCLLVLISLFGEILLARKAKVRFFEKRYSEAHSSLEVKNLELKREVQSQ